MNDIEYVNINKIFEHLIVPNMFSLSTFLHAKIEENKRLHFQDFSAYFSHDTCK